MPVTATATGTAAAFLATAQLIELQGYTPHPEWEGTAGVNVTGAFDGIAEVLGMFTDEIESAFAGWLRLRGLMTGRQYLDAGGLIIEWETDNRGRVLDEVVDELRAAAAALGSGARRKLADDEIVLVRKARAVADAGPLTSDGAAATLGHAQGLLRDLADLVADLDA